MKNRMFRVVAIVMAVCSAFVFASCDVGNDDVKPMPVAYVTLYNASPNSPDLDIVVDERQINAYPFEYADNTGYLPFYTGSRDIEFSPYNANNVVADTTVTLLDQHAYSMFVVDQYEHAEILILEDTSAAAPAEGKAMIRVVNLSPDAAPVALHEKDETSALTANLSFKDASEFFEVDGKTYDFEIVSSGSESTLNLNDINLAPGTYHTIVVRGYRTPPSGNTNVISAEVIRN